MFVGFKMQWDFLILFCMVFCQIWHRYFIWTFPAISEQENVILEAVYNSSKYLKKRKTAG